MRKFLAVAMGSMLALVGFAGAANASATVDLLWDNGTDTIENVDVGSLITATIVLTAGANGISSAGLSVDYSAAATAGAVMVDSYACTLNAPFQACFQDGVDTGSQIQNMTIGALFGGLGAGQTNAMGTVTFLKVANPDGTFAFPVGVLIPDDNMFDLNGASIAATSTYNPAFLVNVPEPGAIAMLAMGLGGVLLAGRGRRS